MMKMRVVILAVVLVFLLAISTWAFNGQRKGFILGGGLGFGVTSYTQTIDMNGHSEISNRESKGAFNTDFRIGYASSEQFALFYDNKVAWFSFTNAYNDDVIVSSGATAIGISYYLTQFTSSTYITGGIALASWSLPFEDNAPDPWQGFGIYGGVGHEFARHLSAELNLVYGNPGIDEDGISISANTLSVMFTLNALAF
jgi:hypothetical protein